MEEANAAMKEPPKVPLRAIRLCILPATSEPLELREFVVGGAGGAAL